MPRTIEIDPVTRIEGHARITIKLDDQGIVEDALFHVTQFRGFEKFCEGRPFPEMPSLTARTCGICPVSHLMASSKACDNIMAVQIPPVAAKLRRIMNYAQITQSHALSFFHLSSPDMLLGWDADPAKRNIFGVIVEFPDLARMGIRLRQIGQSIIALLGNKRVHPAWMVPGGVNAPMTAKKRDTILPMAEEGLEIALKTYQWYKTQLGNFTEEAEHFANFPSLFMGMVDEDGNLEHYDGTLRVVDHTGKIMHDKVPTDNYQDIIGEAVEDFTYMKFPYYKPWGYPNGMYRVGPLARLNICNKCGTPQADIALAEFRALQKDGGPVLSSFHFHYARLIEIIFAMEKTLVLLRNDDILSTNVRARARGNSSRGIGIAEAPRGTLIHDYHVDEHCQMTKANLIIATGHNNLAMNAGVKQVAQHWISGNKLEEHMLNRVEAVIRCYDPCLSCATHALGKMPLHIQLTDARGNVVDELTRG
ncbi:MAG: Ni/Fe hydrogenase subunit alpha [Phycisphaeraceae bacterium]|nr:Ni/Fe hydrogenase subunit alpha [Phycisphaeraceae bacterium]